MSPLRIKPVSTHIMKQHLFSPAISTSEHATSSSLFVSKNYTASKHTTPPSTATMPEEQANEISFQSATEQDASIVVALLSSLYLELGREATSLSFLSPGLVKFIFQDGHTDVLLVKNNYQIAGIITCSGSQAIWAGGKYGTIDEMYIAPEFRRKGLGEACIQKILQLAREKEWRRIVINAPHAGMKKALKFYEKHGFSYMGGCSATVLSY